MVLYLVATPIGNLADITLRALEVLTSCDYILCEDTRHSAGLLKHHGIHKPLKSYHKFNEAEREGELIADLQAGLNIALISDAGSPGIADPGARLVARCRDEDLSVVPIPGPCALVAALQASGLSTERFQFLGFLPRKSAALKRSVAELLEYPGTTICYEAPHRLVELLQVIAQAAPKRRLAIARELTKLYEEIQLGLASDLAAAWETREPRGELVVLVEGHLGAEHPDWEGLSPVEHIALVEKQYGLSRKEAIKFVADLRGLSKRDVYKMGVEDQKGQP